MTREEMLAFLEGKWIMTASGNKYQVVNGTYSFHSKFRNKTITVDLKNTSEEWLQIYVRQQQR